MAGFKCALLWGLSRVDKSREGSSLCNAVPSRYVSRYAEPVLCGVSEAALSLGLGNTVKHWRSNAAVAAGKARCHQGLRVSLAPKPELRETCARLLGRGGDIAKGPSEAADVSMPTSGLAHVLCNDICVTFGWVHRQGFSMGRKSETLNLRVTPEFKELVRVAAEQENRSISNLLEVLVRDYCRRRRVTGVSGARGATGKKWERV